MGISGGKSDSSSTVNLTPEQRETLQIQNAALRDVFMPAYTSTVGGAGQVYNQSQPGSTQVAQTAMDVAGRSGALQEATGAANLQTGSAGLAALFDPQYEQQQVDAALQAGRESGREEMNQQIASYGGAGGLGSSRQALASANLASLQEQRQATAAAQARAGVQANKAAAARELMSGGQSQLTNAQNAAGSRIGFAGAPMDLYSKYSGIVFGTPQASTNPNYAGTQGSSSSGKTMGGGIKF